MKEIRDIIASYELALKEGTACALATVVHVDGSSYRRPGARMLITAEGQLTGAISGGCLEGDALRKAQLVIMEKRTMLVTYDTTDEDDAKLGVGLGCNGIIHVLIEPIDHHSPNNPIALFKTLLTKRQDAALVTLFSPGDKKEEQPGTKMVVLKDGDIFGCSFPLAQEVLADATHSIAVRHSVFREYPSHRLTAFIQWVAPPVLLVVLGAGNDVKPLVSFAGILGWETIVMDGRPAYATSERFPGANKVFVRKPSEILDGISVDGHTLFLLMTHNYNYDLAALRALLLENTFYIGMLGPAKKRERMEQELLEIVPEISRERLSVIHTPAGLDIGAETPEEIALSIIAEIQARLTGKQGASLRDTGVRIHENDSSFIH